MGTLLKIGVIADYNPENPSHGATAAALDHAGQSLELGVETLWLETGRLEAARTDLDSLLINLDGLWAGPGSPYNSPAGGEAAIRWARENNRPFLATWGGFQATLVEFARNKAGLDRAYSSENHGNHGPEDDALIKPMSCSLIAGRARLNILPQTLLHSIYGREVAEERFNCSYGLNQAFKQQLVEAGLVFSGLDDEGSVRAAERPGKGFFMGSLFLPQLSSAPGRPHPLIRAFTRAAYSGKAGRLRSNSPVGKK